MAKKLIGSGGGSNKLVRPGVKAGPSHANKISPLAVSRLGAMQGNHTERGDLPAHHEPLMAGRKPSVPLGNAIATNVGAGGPGTGRTTYKCGSQGTHGTPDRGIPERQSTTFETFFPGIKSKPMGSGK